MPRSQPQSHTAITLTSREHAQKNHLNTSHGWANDVQTIVWNAVGQFFDVYFLHSVDGATDPFGPQGQDWCHTTTVDFVHYTPQHTAIPSHGPQQATAWRSAWTGAVVTNQGNITGVPQGAKVAYFSGLPQDGADVQHIWAAWSDDDGQTFSHVLNDAQPVINACDQNTTRNNHDERDPSVFYWDGVLLMYTSEAEELGVYRSLDGIHWTPATAERPAKILPATFFAGHAWHDNAPVECPVLRTLITPSGQQKQVLFFGAKDVNAGQTTGTYYVVGHLDRGGLFVNETVARRVDQGSDFYGANVTGSDQITTAQEHVIMLAWVGNWHYMTDGIHADQDGQSPYAQCLGAYSSPRCLSLRDDLTLAQTLATTALPPRMPKRSASLAAPLIDERTGQCVVDGWYRLCDLRHEPVAQTYELTLQESADRITGCVKITLAQGKDAVCLTYEPTSGDYHVTQSASELADNAHDQRAARYYTNGPRGDQDGYRSQSGYRPSRTMSLTIITDQSSVEVFFPNGTTYTVARFGTAAEQQLTVAVDTPTPTKKLCL